MKSHTRVAVIGCSVLYHLTKASWKARNPKMQQNPIERRQP